MSLGIASRRQAVSSTQNDDHGQRLGLQKHLLAALEAADQKLERSRLLCMLLLLLALMPLAILKARSSPFSGDEVYTLRIAEQPNLGTMLRVSRTLDMHPPLHYVLERAALETHLPRWFAGRLPSLIAMPVALWLLFTIVALRAGNVMATLATAVFWLTPTIEFAWFNRPYALWIFLLCACIAVWQRIGRTARPRLWTFVLALTGCAMTLNHMIGVACLLPLAIAEVARSWRTRLWRPGVFIALALPCLAAFLYLKQVRDFAENSFAPHYLQTTVMLGQTYGDLLQRVVGVLVACLVAAALLHLLPPRGGVVEATFAPERSQANMFPGLQPEETALGWVLLGLPVLLALAAAVRHSQFLTRYGACSSIGLALLAPWLLQRFTPWPRTVAMLAIFATFITSAVETSSATFNPYGQWRAFEPMGTIPLRFDQLDHSIPIAFADPLSYTEANERESPELLRQLYYVYDRRMAERYAGTTVLEKAPRAVQLLHFGTQTAAWSSFLTSYPRFYVMGSYDDPEAWLLRALEACGADLRYLGKIQTTYPTDDLYMVTHTESCQR